MLAGLSQLVRLLVSLGFLALLAGGSWYGYRILNRHEFELREKQAAIADRDKKIREQEDRLLHSQEQLAESAEQIGQLEVDLEDKEAEIEALDTALRYSKVDQRRAHIVVLDKKEGEDGVVQTTFRFVEVDAEGKAIGESRQITVDGDLLYVDSWVVKFDDELVETADPLRSTSICLFRRLFGEHQAPAEGMELDPPLRRPAAYGGDDLSQFEQELWENFWKVANDPELAQKYGVRAAHGEAPSQKLEKGYIYKLTLRASGGLTFTPEKLPAGIE